MYPKVLIILFLVALNVDSRLSGAEPSTVTMRLYHVGDSKKPDWRDISSAEPYARRRLVLRFKGRSSAKTLEISAGEVKATWRIALNGKKIGELEKGGSLRRQYFDVEGMLQAGNRLTIEGSRGSTDDILVGRVFLHEKPIWEYLGLTEVNVQVVDTTGGASLPCRLTLTRVSSSSFAVAGSCLP